MRVSLSVCLSVCLNASLSVCLSVCLFECESVRLSLHPLPPPPTPFHSAHTHTSSLTPTLPTPCQSRGFVGRNEMYRRFQGDSLPGGYDHFNWVIFDEVHALDGEDGDALQRLIRAMSCKFLALSATVGNAHELRGWLERVRGDQLLGRCCKHYGYCRVLVWCIKMSYFCGILLRLGQFELLL